MSFGIKPFKRVDLMNLLAHTFGMKPEDLERFNSYLPSPRTENECWIWEGTRASDGYGKFWLDRKSVPAHRAAVLLEGREIGKGKIVTHTCDQPLCVNPAHLQVSTHINNMREMVQRKRHMFGEKSVVAVLTEKQCRSILERTSQGATVRGLAREMGVSRSTLRHVAKGFTWRHLHDI